LSQLESKGNFVCIIVTCLISFHVVRKGLRTNCPYYVNAEPSIRHNIVALVLHSDSSHIFLAQRIGAQKLVRNNEGWEQVGRDVVWALDGGLSAFM